MGGSRRVVRGEGRGAREETSYYPYGYSMVDQ